MEPVFINNLKQTKEHFIEMNKKHSAFTIYFFGAFFLIAYLALAMFIYFTSYNIVFSVVIALIGTLLSIYPHIRIYILARNREKQFLELLNDIPEGKTLFFEDHLMSVSTNNDELKLEYTKIQKVKQSKNLYLLVLKKKLVVMVDKNRFEKGNCEEFEKFIAEKAVNAKIKL